MKLQRNLDSPVLTPTSRSGKRSLIALSLLAFTGAFNLSAPLGAEGSAQVGLNQRLFEYDSSEANELYVDIINPGEIINVSVLGESPTRDDIRIEIYDPLGIKVASTTVKNGNIAWGEEDLTGPLSTPYHYCTQMTGPHEVRLKNKDGDLLDRFDITVTSDLSVKPDPTKADGRLFAKVWRFNAGSFAVTESTDADFFALVPGGVPGTNYVWKLDLNNFAGFVYNIAANQIGVDAPNSGLSTEEDNNSYSPLYDVYLGYPGITLPEPSSPPTASNIRFIDDSGIDSSISPGSTPGIQDAGFFEFDSDVASSYSIAIDVNLDGQFGAGDVFLCGAAVVGLNSVPWDGKDHFGQVLPEGEYPVQLSLRLGEYHFIAEDAETSGGSQDGLTIFRAMSPTTLVDTEVFWDDFTLLGGTTTLPNGALSSTPQGKHSWGDFTSGGFGNETFIDTYVYGLSTSASLTVIVDDDDTGDPDSDGDGVPNSADLDDDNDGLPDTTEGSGDNDGDGVPNKLDLDSDNDGISDLIEAGGVDSDNNTLVDNFTDSNGDGLDDALAAAPLADPDTDSDGFENRVDIDSDGDGIVDNVEGQLTATYAHPCQTDADGDGLDDSYDPDNGGTPIVPVNTDGADGADYVDYDSDNDEVPDEIEGHDADMDGVADTTASGVDDDNDGLDDAFDTFDGPGMANPIGANAALQNTDGADELDWRDDDDDNDGIPTFDEDGNNNGDWADDDEDSDGKPDYLDVNDLDTDGDGVPNVDDADSDNDGVPDSVEGNGDSDGDGIPDSLDLDSDGDGISDLVEAGGTDSDGDGVIDNFVDVNGDGLDDTLAITPLPDPDTDGDGVKDRVDGDSDGDGIPDNVEGQDSASYVAPSGNDTDGDGIDDSYDADNGGTPFVPTNTDGAGLPDYRDTDSDDDGVPDLIEGNDANMDGVADATPTGSDADGDGIDDAFDNFAGPGFGNATGSNVALQNTDGDSQPDWRDDDDDNDGIPTIDEDGNNNGNWADDDEDNDGTPDYLDTDDSDGDGITDDVDLDDDNDGIPDSVESDGAIDTDGDGVPDSRDADSDNDGVADIIEAGGTDADGDAQVDNFTDGNGDGLDDALAVNPLPLPDTDSDGVRDGIDSDSDGDGIPDVVENGSSDVNGDGQLDGFTDANGDGFDDATGTAGLVRPDTDNDGILDALDIDADNDGIVDNVEGQTSAAYVPPTDTDSDGDGWDDAYDADSGGTPFAPANLDGVDEPDYLDDDTDNDGVLDTIEGHDANMDGIADTEALNATSLSLAAAAVATTDADGDGLFDAYDTVVAPATGNSVGSNAPLQNTDGIDERDWRDVDDDNDGVLSSSEDQNGNGDLVDDDENGDGTPNYLDDTAALLEVAKTAMDDNGAPLAPGDVITYTLVVKNLTVEDATSSELFDAIPANTNYVANSTFLNGAQVADVRVQSALVTGLSVQTPGDLPGLVVAGGTAIVQFQVVVDGSAVAGTQITNSASASFNGSLSGGPLGENSDDPNTPADDDGTTLTVGAAPSLYAEKTADDTSGAPLLANDELTYSIRISNSGTLDATTVSVTDAIPANTTYVAGSLLLDPDGSGFAPAFALTDAQDGDGGDFNLTTAGSVTVSLETLALGAEALVSFTVQVSAGVLSGDIVSNQAVITSAELPSLLSDADGNALNGFQATNLVVGTEPGLRLIQSVVDLDGGVVLPGDVLEYRYELMNFGAANATNAVLADALPPAGTNYVIGSTTQNGQPLADAAGDISPLVSGVSAPLIAPGQTIRWTARIQTNAGLATGTTVTDQASFVADGGLSGISDSDLDDGIETGNDPNNPNDDDPTVVIIGGAPGSAALAGMVWQDLDHDRVFDTGEPGIDGFMVEILQTGTMIDTTRTKSDGHWEFKGLVPGSGYQVRFRDPDSGAVWGDPISDAPGSTVSNGVVENLTLVSGASFAGISLPLDPSGVLYDADTRAPLSGATVTLQGPAGFDPITQLLPGQQGQVTGPDGRYRFDLIGAFPAGVYTLGINAPEGYSPIVPSATIPPQAGALDPTGFPDPFLVVPNNGAPVGADPTDYFLAFDLAAGDPNVLNNHVPLDPINVNAITVVKTSSKNRVSVGEIVPFTIRATNNLGGAITGAQLTDLMPAGFKYVKGSAQVDDVPTEPTVGTNPLELTWAGIDFAAGQTRTLSLLAVIGTGVERGVFNNRAYAVDGVGTLLSNLAEATILVVPDALFEQSDIIGQVFEDRDGDGYQGDDEPGIPGITLVTVRGLRTTTDEFGRYHITRPEDPTPTIGSNFILKLDPRTLPVGFQVTTENPRVIRMTPGKLHKINFGVLPAHQPVQPALITSTTLNLNPDQLAKFESSGFAMYADQPAQENSLVTETVDGELDALDVHVRTDGSGAEPTLNIVALPDVVAPEEELRFYGYSDYMRWIETAEVRIFENGASTRAKPLVVLRLEFDGEGTSLSTPLNPGAYSYVLRVYAENGLFDETSPKTLVVTELEHERLHGEVDGGPWPGYGENFRWLKNIPVSGARVLVDGRDVPEGFRVTVMDNTVPVDADGQFAAAEWVPYGDHDVNVNIRTRKADGLTVVPSSEIKRLHINRQLHVPKDDWFFVALAELTVGTSSVGGATKFQTGQGGLIEDATGSAFEDEVYYNGRAAFYLKGVVRGEYLLTASLDTRDQPLSEIFSSLDQKDPQSLFRRIQPDEVYAVYGDDSTTSEDAPTQGKFYVRLERGESYALWGNFTSGLTGSDLAQVDRALYGAKFHWVSPEKTSRGDDRAKTDLFAASPDSVLARDELRGTGGSVYFLRNQDLTVGSERLRVEVRDADSGIVLESKYLIPFTDYTLDYIQGRVVLTSPLQTVADDGQLISDSSLSGNPVFLVARYEHTPSFTDTDNLSVGGRTERWINDKVQVGITASEEEQSKEDQSLFGVDVTYRHSDDSYVKVEGAHTEGNGFGEQGSNDGGFTFGAQAQSPNEKVEAGAFRVEGAVALSDVEEELSGDASFYYQNRSAGFSAPGQLTATDTEQWGIEVDTPLSDSDAVHFQVDEFDIDGGVSNRAYDLDVTRKLDEKWSATVGARRTEVEDDGNAINPNVGDRTDVAGRVDYESGEDWKAHLFGQTTVDKTDRRSRNHRVGAGGTIQLTDKLALGGELSGGDGGLGAGANADYKVSDLTSFYLNARSSSDRSDTGVGSQNGSFAAGMRTRFTEELSVFAEERVLHGSGQRGLTHSLGVDLTPTERWTVGAFFETGELEQPNGMKLERTSVTTTGNYKSEPFTYGGALEFRDENVSGTSRDVWVAKNNFSVRLDRSWTGLAELNLLRSNDSSGTFFDGEFTENLLGAAYRPVDNDRWNTLFTYRYLEDTPTSGQVNATGNGDLFQQRSHVLAVDGTWQAMKWLDIGGKYAIRSSKLRTDDSAWFKSTAQLAILRGDLHIIKDWDFLLEGRWTNVDLADDRKYGALAAVYKHFGDNVKVGIGYNFTDFDDDITNLSYDARGVFFNIVGKY